MNEWRVWLLVLAAVLMVGLAPAPASAEEQAMSLLNPNAHAPVGFLAPTLEGDFRFRVAVNAWLINVLQIDAESAVGGGSLEKDLGWILKHLKYYIPVDVELRKGTWGAFVHMLFLGLGGSPDVLGPITLDWDDTGYLIDLGASYELGRWRLGEGSRAPEITLEPFFGGRVIRQSIGLSLLRVDTRESLNSAVPIVGMRTFIDLTEHWNLAFEGDYGGWNIDRNHQTWQAVGLIGYRWPAWGGHWNLQVGYRAMRWFDLRNKLIDIQMDARGPNIVIGVEF